VSRKANPVAVGVFVLGAIALAIVAVLVFGTGKLFQSTQRFVIYFDSSVMGLDPGAPVMFRGVKVGEVEAIEAFYYPERDEIAIPVYVELVEGSVKTGTPAGGMIASVERLIADGLRAQLAAQSLVTGKLYVSLDMQPEREAKLRGLDPDTPEIPSIPTIFQQAQEAIARVFQRLEQAPLDEIVESIRSTLARVDELVNTPELESALRELDSTIVAFRDLAKAAQKEVGPAGQGLQDTAAAARDTLAQVERAVDELAEEVGQGSPLQYQVLHTLEEVAKAARSLRALSDTLNAQPESLVFGRSEAGESQ